MHTYKVIWSLEKFLFTVCYVVLRDYLLYVHFFFLTESASTRLMQQKKRNEPKSANAVCVAKTSSEKKKNANCCRYHSLPLNA